MAPNPNSRFVYQYGGKEYAQHYTYDTKTTNKTGM